MTLMFLRYVSSKIIFKSHYYIIHFSYKSSAHVPVPRVKISLIPAMGGCASTKIGYSPSKYSSEVSDADASLTTRKWKRVQTQGEARVNYRLEGLLDHRCTKSHLEFRSLLEYPCALECFYEFAHFESPYLSMCLKAWLDIHGYNEMKSDSYCDKNFVEILVESIAGNIKTNILVSTEIRSELSLWLNVRLNSGLGVCMPSVFEKAYVELFHTLHDTVFLPLLDTERYKRMTHKLNRKYNVVKASDFEYRRVLGKGSYGLVCEVWKKSTATSYVMKIQSKVQQSATFGDEPWRACLELHAFAGCQHPFIVELVYAFQTKTLLMLVMTDGKGRDLGNLLKHNGPFGIDHVHHYSAEIASALVYMHRKNFVYRDLKPANILLNADGHIQLIDFGAVGDLDGRILELCQKDSVLSHQSMPPEADVDMAGIAGGDLDDMDLDAASHPQRAVSLVGTYGYMAPEIIELIMQQDIGAPLPTFGYTKAVDWWSLGVVIYKLLVSEYPFEFEEGHRNTVPTLNSLSGVVDYTPLSSYPQAVAFIGELLCTVENNRLGYGENGSANVLAHPFFSTISWPELEEKLTLPPSQPGSKPEPTGPTKYHNLKDLLLKNRKADWLNGPADSESGTVQLEYDGKSAFSTWQYASREAIALEIKHEVRTKSSNTKAKNPSDNTESSVFWATKSKRSTTASTHVSQQSGKSSRSSSMHMHDNEMLGSPISPLRTL